MFLRCLVLPVLAVSGLLAGCVGAGAPQVVAIDAADAGRETAAEVASPDGRIVVRVSDRDGRLHYTVARDGNIVVRSCVVVEAPARASQARDGADRTWTQPWGERRVVVDRFNELALEVRRRGTGQRLALRFRVFDDGLGFRYEVPAQPGFERVTIIDELTEFNVDEAATA